MTNHNYPRALSSLVPGITKGIFDRKNLLLGKMLAAWPDIAGDLAAHALPIELKFAPVKKGAEAKNRQAVLHLAVQPAHALEFSYQTPLLIERLNMFCGYPAIRDIRIVQDSEIAAKKRPAPRKTLPPLPPEEQERIKAQVSRIQENDLQTALENLGKSIASRAKKDKTP